ncbi:MAG: choice-of-anchor D domain-containing protein, partial [Myxococcota bacterium]|nr:choice-of-anchor D domain-containing protein [Myxococcota bacterium]
MGNGLAGRWGMLLAVTTLLATGMACNENELQGLIPDIFVNPDEVQFGTVTAGVTSEQLLAVHNSGGGTLTVSSVVIQDGSSGFGVEDFAGEITPESFVELTVTFDPMQLGPAEDVIVIDSDDPDEPEVLVPVYAVDVLPAPEPAIAWSPSSLDWGAVLSGQSITKVVTLSSVGTSDLDVLSVYLATGTSADFYLVGNPAPVSLAPGAVTEVQVSYAPSDAAPDAGNLMISSNDPDTPQAMVPLTGELEQAPDIELIPTHLAFDQPGVGNEQTMDAQIWNVGDLDLELGTLTTVGSVEFTLDQDPSLEVIAPGESTTVVVRYAPTDTTADNGSVLIPSNDPDEDPAVLTLSAPAPYPIIEADPWSVDFGDVKIGTSSSEWVLVSNVGTANLELYSVSIGGNQSFSVTSNPAGTVLAPGDSVQMEVTFEPVWEATVMGTADIASNDPATPTASVDLAGNGAASGIEIDPDTVSFGQVGAGCEVTTDIHVRSVGTVPLDLYSY